MNGYQLGGSIISEPLIRRSIEQILACFKSELGDSPPFLHALESFYIALDRFKNWLTHNKIVKLTVGHLLSQRDSASCFWGILSAWNEFILQGKALIGRVSQFDALIEEFDVLKDKLEAITTSSDARFVEYLRFENHRFEFDTILHDVKHELPKYISANTATIFTSATLSINAQLHYFTQPLGLQDVKNDIIDSPFDYQRQALLYIPRVLCDSTDERERQLAFQKLCEKLVKANDGKTFVLCTSHKVVQIIGARSHNVAYITQYLFKVKQADKLYYKSFVF